MNTVHLYIILYEGSINPDESNNMVQYLELRELSHGMLISNVLPQLVLH